MHVWTYKVRVRPRAGTLACLITIGNTDTGRAGDQSLRPAVLSSGEQNTLSALADTASAQYISFLSVCYYELLFASCHLSSAWVAF